MKKPSPKLQRIRLDLEEYDFEIEYVKGKQNVIADALSRINITSEELKSINVVTRSMTKNKVSDDDEVSIRQPDQLRMFNALSFEEVLQLPKLEFQISNKFNKVLCTPRIKNKTRKNDLLLVSGIHLNTKDEDALVHLFQNIEKCATKLNLDQLALPIDDEIFDFITTEELKRVANKSMKYIEILLYEKPKIIKDPRMASEILEKTHNSPTGGHIGQTKMYTKLRREFYWKIF